MIPTSGCQCTYRTAPALARLVGNAYNPRWHELKAKSELHVSLPNTYFARSAVAEIQQRHSGHPIVRVVDQTDRHGLVGTALLYLGNR